MRILITGGRGTIGFVLLQYLRNKGHEVWSCDLVHHHDERHVRSDVADFRQLAGIFEKVSFDFVYHLAAEYGRWNGEDYSEQLWLTNAVGTKNILKLQKRFGFRLVFASTSEVYGDVGEVMDEDLMDRMEIRQLNDYALSKWVNEIQIMNAASMWGTESLRVRIFNSYGPGEYYTPYRGAICRFIYCALKNKPYTVYQDHYRSSIFIGDTVRILAACIDNFVPGEVFNIGGTERHNMKRISDIILQSCQKDETQVTYKPKEPFTTREKRITFEKTSRLLGYIPAVSLETGINRTIEWMKRVYIDNDDRNPVTYI